MQGPFDLEGNENAIYILLSPQNPAGFVGYGQYFFGDDRQATYACLNIVRQRGSQGARPVAQSGLLKPGPTLLSGRFGHTLCRHFFDKLG